MQDIVSRDNSVADALSCMPLRHSAAHHTDAAYNYILLQVQASFFKMYRMELKPFCFVTLQQVKLDQLYHVPGVSNYLKLCKISHIQNIHLCSVRLCGMFLKSRWAGGPKRAYRDKLQKSTVTSEVHSDFESIKFRISISVTFTLTLSDRCHHH